MQQMTDDNLINGSNSDKKERIISPDVLSVRQVRPDFAYFMNDELR